MSDRDPTKAGTFYERDARGRIREVGQDPGDRAVDMWICRRVADFPLRLPSGAAIDRCGHCRALIAYNPARQIAAPRVCMQCAGIEPLPFTEAE